jgi:hypothetical protein
MIVLQKLCSLPWGRKGGQFQSFIITTGTVCTHPEGYQPMMLRGTRGEWREILHGHISIEFFVGIIDTDL